MAYGARLEIVLGVKTLAGSNPASSAVYQQKRGRHDRVVIGARRVTVRTRSIKHSFDWAQTCTGARPQDRRPRRR